MPFLLLCAFLEDKLDQLPKHFKLFQFALVEKAGHFSNVLTLLILASCRRPEAPRNGGMRGDNFNHNEKVVFYCDENYQLVGQSQITCKDGSWSDLFPKCTGTPPF